MKNEAVLHLIAAHLNQAGMVWGMGGSTLLQIYGIVSRANDIDLLIAWENAEQSHAVLQILGNSERGKPSPPFCTIHYFRYEIQQVHVDVMSRYRIRHDQGIYELPFDTSSITGMLQKNDMQIPLTSLEDWYVLYLLHPSKHYKADLIEEYFKREGIGRPDLLKRTLDQELPEPIRKRIGSTLAVQTAKGHLFRTF